MVEDGEQWRMEEQVHYCEERDKETVVLMMNLSPPSPPLAILLLLLLPLPPSLSIIAPLFA